MTRQLTNEDIASLLSDCIRLQLSKLNTNLKQDGRYCWEINFTVKDEYIVIEDNCLARKTKVEGQVVIDSNYVERQVGVSANV